MRAASCVAHAGAEASSAVVTIGELAFGVLAASDDDARSRRADTLALARTADSLPITEAVMSAWARLATDCRGAGLLHTIRPTDALIAATGITHGLPIVTQGDDFERIATVNPAFRIIRD